jgi:hypothetical protein
LKLSTLGLLLVGALVLTNLAMRRRQITQAWSKTVEAADRYVDIGVDLHVVRASPSGRVLIEGARPMEILRIHRRGWIIDTKADPPRRVPGDAGISQNPQTWYCSEDQEPLILHADSAPVGELALGGMGAGKTTAGVIWLYMRWLENLGSRLEGGITAPTETRLSLVFNELFRMWPRAWWSFNSENKIITLCDGFRLRGVSTHRQSASQGSRLQGFNWVFWLGDELQDQTREFVDIQARLRAKADGRAKRLATATAKDAPEWRTLKGSLLDSGNWSMHTLLGVNSPFVHPSHWENMKSVTSDREYRRLVLAEDLPPDTATYPAWSRNTNLITVPELGWTDVTRHELRGAGPNYTMLVGHDPGTTMDVSLFMRAYISARDEKRYHAGAVKPFWVVLGELNTETSTTEFHIKKLLETIRDRWQLNLVDRQGRVTSEVNQILVHADPASNSDQRTDKSVYTQFANAQIRCRPAAWNKNNDGHGKVPREPAVEMINSLFCNAANERRLFVAKDERGLPAAPKLVSAIESAERDMAGRAEVHLTKGRHHDMTHWPAALRYALWPIERPRLQMQVRES